MVKNILFQLHWIFGITAGLVLAIIGVTGAILSFEDDILDWMNPGVMTVEAPAEGAAQLTPQQLVDAMLARAPQARVNSVSVARDPEKSAQVGLAPAGGGQGRGEQRYVDPYTGQELGRPQGQEFFRLVMQLHRWLVMPGGNQSIGKQIVGASTIILVYLAISGIYLRWPRRALDWRAWLKLDLKKKGRSLYWSLHSVIGVYVLIAYLVMSLTGLYWSYDWYRNGLSLALTGKPAQTQGQGGPPGGSQGGPQGGGEGQRGRRGGGEEQAPPPPPPMVSLDPAWNGFLAATGGHYETANVSLPRKEGDPIQVRFLPEGAQHERASDQMKLDPATGAVLSHEKFQDKSFGEQIYGSIFPLHSGAYFGVVGVILWMIASIMMPLFFITGWLLYLDRRKKKRLARAAAAEAGATTVLTGPARPAPTTAATDTLLIAFASQTGFAESLAWRSAALFKAGGRPVAVKPLGGLTAAGLAGHRQALFIVSTFGEGEPPDSARAFDRKVLGKTADLAHLSYGVLSLGDREYRDYCGFGRSLDAWLHRSGAKHLFDTVEVDDADDGAIRHWQHHVGLLAGADDLPDWTPPAYERWKLAARTHLNPGSAGGPVWLIRLTPPDAAATWQAGDIAEIGPEAETGTERPPHREYSIASLPADGAVELVVRLMKRPDGTSGLGSGWLIERAALGQKIDMRLRANPTFHAADGAPQPILIGNGTGIAGLRAHLKARAAAGLKGAWLVFGERHAAHDSLFADEIAAWQTNGVLDRVDLAFSRDGAEKVYVQDVLRRAADAVTARVEAGAAIYVCGSLEGMAPGVEAALVEALGQDRLDALSAEGRYRRDVY